MKGSFTWDGLDPAELESRFEALQSTIPRELEKAAKDIGVRIQSSAAMGAPVDEGRLSGSIEKVVERVGKHVVNVITGSNVEYAPYQEFGTVMHSAQPFLRPALEDNRKWIVERIEDAVDSAFSSVGFDVGGPLS